MGFLHIEFMFMLLSWNGCHSPRFTANEIDLYLTLAQRQHLSTSMVDMKSGPISVFRRN